MKLYLGTDDGLAVFEGQDEEWHPRYVRLEDHQITAIVVVGQVLWAGTPKGLWRSLDGGPTWWPSITGPDLCHARAMVAVPGVTETILVGTEPAAILLSRDAGETWVEAPDVARLRDQQAWSLPYSPAAGCIRGFTVTKNHIYAAAEVGGVLRSDDGGDRWRLLEGVVHPDVHDVAGCDADPELVYAATGGGRFRSRDGGELWEFVGDGYTRAVWADSERPETVLTGPARYVGAMGRVERTNDGGDTWALASDGFEIPMSNMIERFVGAGSHVLALTSDGDLYTAKRGLWMWRRLDLGLAPVRAAAFSEE